ncbi:MAG: MltA domain-containing protein [Neisseria sp.]|nr:MltA domain-containing protein [Neisseria sp.]
MNRLIRLSFFLIPLTVLTACPYKKPASVPVQPKQQGGRPGASNGNTGIPQPTGQRSPIGLVVSPAGSSASYKAVDYSVIPQWHQQNFVKSLEAFIQGCGKLQAQSGWRNVCLQAAQTHRQNRAAQQFFEQYFTPWQVSENGKLGGTVTGYYEPVLTGDTHATHRARFPIYGVPYDFVSVELPANLRNSKTSVRIRKTGQNSGRIAADGEYTANLASFPINERTKALKGRFAGNRFLPYHTRNEINGGALNGKAPILGYADDPVELFFLQIQGSGRLKTPTGQYIRLGYADKNEYPYVSIGRYMADRGYLALAQTTMQGIKDYMRQHPQKLAEVLGQNPSYVFFRRLDDNSDGPIGALGTPLMGEYAGAVDRHHITLGAPLFVATTHPETQYGLNRLIMAQDTGSAIKGAVRVDYFWGYGDEAGRVAGKMKHPGYVWQLLPNGVSPQYRP